MDQSYAIKLLELGAGASASGGNFTIVTLDKYGAAEEKVLSITLQGVNNAPTFTAPNLAIMEGASPLTGSLGAADVDTNDAGRLKYSLAYGGAPGVLASGTESAVVDGHYGQLTLDASGNYKYTVTNHALAQAQNDKDTFTVTVTDGHGGSVSHDIVINVTGTNDAPKITSATYDSNAKSGTFAFTDTDIGDDHALSVSIDGVPANVVKVSDLEYIAKTQVGDFTFTHSGTDSAGSGQQWSYSFIADTTLAAAIRAGQLGDSYTLDLKVTDIDDQGHKHDTVSQTLNLHILGTNEAPTAVDVDNGLLLGHVTAINNEASDTLSFHADSGVGLFGVMLMHTNGNYEYTLDTTESTLGTLRNAYDASSDMHVHDHFGFSVTDGHETSTEATHSGSLSIDLHNGAQLDAAGGQLFFANGNLTGTEHNDVILGGSHDDILYGGAGDDILYGGAGHNQLYGGDGNDTLYAGKDGDHLYGGAGNDHLYGGAGNDFLDGGANTFATDHGGNHLNGGAGNDVLVFHQGDTIDGGSETDMLLVSNAENPTGSVNDLFANTANVEVVVTGDAVDSLTDMQKLADKGITFGADNKVELDASKGWAVDHANSTSEHSVWTNASEHLSVTTATNEDAAADAAKTILLTHTS